MIEPTGDFAEDFLLAAVSAAEEARRVLDEFSETVAAAIFLEALDGYDCL